MVDLALGSDHQFQILRPKYASDICQFCSDALWNQTFFSVILEDLREA